MTKLKWGTSFNGQSGPFPSFPQKPTKWVSPEEKARLKAKRAIEAKKRQERCDELRYRAIIKKFGLNESIYYGVPRDYITRIKMRSARAKRRKERRAERNLQKERLQLIQSPKRSGGRD